MITMSTAMLQSDKHEYDQLGPLILHFQLQLLMDWYGVDCGIGVELSDVTSVQPLGKIFYLPIFRDFLLNYSDFQHRKKICCSYIILSIYHKFVLIFNFIHSFIINLDFIIKFNVNLKFYFINYFCLNFNIQIHLYYLINFIVSE